VPALTTVHDLTLQELPSLTSVNVPLLESAHGVSISSAPSLATANFSSLQTVSQVFALIGDDDLSSLALSELTSVQHGRGHVPLSPRVTPLE
jgi:hypothetical protein